MFQVGAALRWWRCLLAGSPAPTAGAAARSAEELLENIAEPPSSAHVEIFHADIRTGPPLRCVPPLLPAAWVRRRKGSPGSTPTPA